MGIHPYRGVLPQTDPTVYVADGAQLIGDVVIGPQSSVWFNVVIRGDVNYIRIGARTNIQDGSTVHVGGDGHPTVIGDNCSIGHNAVVHGCTLGDRCLVGIGAIILNGAKIGEDSIVAAGALVPEGKEFPPRSLIMGVPGKLAGSISAEHIARIERTSQNYVRLSAAYREEGAGQALPR